MAQEEMRASKTRRPTVAVIQEGCARSFPGGTERHASVGTSSSRGRASTDVSGSLRKDGQVRATETGSGQSTMRRVVHTRNSVAIEPPMASTNPSLTIYREQYCCLSRRTRLERLLFGLVTLLAVVILLLFLIVMLVIRPHDTDDDENSEPLLDKALPWTSIRGDTW